MVQSLFQLLNPLAFLLFAGAFFGLSIARRERGAPLIFAVSYAVGAAAFTADFLRLAMPTVFASFLTNGLYMAMSIAFAAGLAVRYRGRAPLGPLAAAGLGGFTAYALVYVSTPDILTRTLAINFAIAGVMSIGVAAIWGRAPRAIDRIIFVVAAALAAQCVARPLIVGLFLEGPLTMESYTSSPLYMTLHLVVGALAIVMAMSLLVAHGIETFEDLARRSVTDALSGVCNRRGFEDEGASLIARAKAANEPVAVIIADIDCFKAVNDTYGHAFGDTVIAEMGVLLRRYANGGRIAGRLGGEEFALLAPARLADAHNLAEAMRRKFAATPFAVAGGVEKTFSASFGVAERQPEETLFDVLARADEALYLAKQTGRNRVACESDVQVARLEGALDRLDRRQYRRHRPATAASLRA